MSVGDTHVLHFLGRSQFYIILTFSEKGEFICVSVNCNAVMKYSICTCRLGRNSVIVRPHILKIGSADSSDPWPTLPTPLKSGVSSILLSSLVAREARIWHPRKEAKPTYLAFLSLLLSSLALSIQLCSFPQQRPVFRSPWGTGRHRRKDSLAECVHSQKWLSWGRPLAVASHGAQQPAEREGCTCSTATLSTHRCRV